MSQNKPKESPVCQEEVCTRVLQGKASWSLKTRVEKLSPTKSLCSYICLQLLETTWSRQVRGYLAPREKPLPIPTKNVGNTPRESPNPGPSRRPTGIRLPTHQQPIDSPRTLNRPVRPGAGVPRCPRPPPRRGEARGGGNSSPPPRRQHPPRPGAGSAEGGDTARPNAPRHACPASRAQKPSSRPVGQRVSAIRPPNSRPARTPRRPGAGEGGGASSRAGGRKRGGKKMARSAGA